MSRTSGADEEGSNQFFSVGARRQKNNNFSPNSKLEGSPCRGKPTRLYQFDSTAVVEPIRRFWREAGQRQHAAQDSDHRGLPQGQRLPDMTARNTSTGTQRHAFGMDCTSSDWVWGHVTPSRFGADPTSESAGEPGPRIPREAGRPTNCSSPTPAPARNRLRPCPHRRVRPGISDTRHSNPETQAGLVARRCVLLYVWARTNPSDAVTGGQGNLTLNLGYVGRFALMTPGRLPSAMCREAAPRPPAQNVRKNPAQCFPGTIQFPSPNKVRWRAAPLRFRLLHHRERRTRWSRVAGSAINEVPAWFEENQYG